MVFVSTWYVRRVVPESEMPPNAADHYSACLRCCCLLPPAISARTQRQPIQGHLGPLTGLIGVPDAVPVPPELCTNTGRIADRFLLMRRRPDACRHGDDESDPRQRWINSSDRSTAREFVCRSQRSHFSVFFVQLFTLAPLPWSKLPSQALGVR